MGRKIINARRAALSQVPVNYLTEFIPAEFAAEYTVHLPGKMLGSEFLAKYKTHDDPVTVVQPDAEYRVYGPAIRYVVQQTQDGYGHAVFQSREFAGDEPVLLCLGDHLFRGGAASCPAQMITAFSRNPGRSLSAVNRISADELKGYGTIAGQRRPTDPAVIDVIRIIESPPSM